MRRLLCILCGVLLLCGCASTRYVPIEVVKTEYRVKTDTFLQRDSIHVLDSVYVDKMGDTVFVNRYKVIYKDRFKEVLKVDSFVRTDSINVPYPVEKSLTWWERVKMDFGEMFMLVSVLLLLFSVYLSRKK